MQSMAMANLLSFIHSFLHTSLAPPFFFLLINLVVATLYLLHSKLLQRTPPPKHIDSATALDPPPPPHGVDSLVNSFDRVPDEPSRPSDDPPPPPLASRPSKLFVPPHIRLVRSKSDQLVPPKKTSAPIWPSASRFQKSSTFCSTFYNKPRSGVVVIKDPPEGDSASGPGSEDIDKKAEDFIGTFYRKIKLQR